MSRRKETATKINAAAKSTATTANNSLAGEVDRAAVASAGTGQPHWVHVVSALAAG